MSKAHNAELQARVQQYMREHGMSQARLAQVSGINKAIISQWLRGQYNGDIAATEQAIEEYLRTAMEHEQAQDKAITYGSTQDYIPTSISEDIYNLIRYCQLAKGIAIAHGDAGIGKTKAARQYLKDNPTQSYYITLTPSMGTGTNILRLMARELKIPYNSNKVQLNADLHAKLDGSNKVIIIDEAQHLKYAAIEEIRDFCDLDRDGIGIVLIGNSEIYDRLKGRQEALFAQQFSRIRFPRRYTTRDIKDDDVKLLFPLLAEQRKEKELQFLGGVCCSKWGIRGAVNVYRNAVDNDDIGYNSLYARARNMGIVII